MVHPRGTIRRGFFRSRFRNRTAAAHCGHALVKPGAPIGAPPSEPLLAVHARTCRPAAKGQLPAPLRSPEATEIGFAPETIAPHRRDLPRIFLGRDDDRLPDIARAYEPDKLMGYCVAIYFAKLLVWDKVLGFGSTDALAGFAAITANLVVSFYFAKRGFENVARIIKR